ncbi:MAG: ATP-binding protein [Clostridium sp.]
MLRLTEKASMDNLNAAIDQILLYTADFIGLSSKQENEIRIICEEILVNIIHYAYEDDGDMTVEAEYDEKNDCLRLCFMDSGVAFNPLLKKKPDLTEDVMEREIGGLGIFMVRKLSDAVTYERIGNTNKLVILKQYTKEAKGRTL